LENRLNPQAGKPALLARGVYAALSSPAFGRRSGL